MDLVVIPQSILAMSVHLEGSLNSIRKQPGKSVQSEWNDDQKDKKVTHVNVGSHLGSFNHVERSNFAIISANSGGTQSSIAVCMGENYTFCHRNTTPDLSCHHVKYRTRLTEYSLLKVTKECLSWILNCRYLISELESLYEEQCCRTEDNLLFYLTAYRDENKTPRLLNLFERCRIQIVGFKSLRKKLCVASSALRDNFANHSYWGVFWSSMATAKLELLHAIGNTLTKEVEIYSRYVTTFGVRQVDISKQISERVENLCLLFEKYGKLALLLRTFIFEGCSINREILYSMNSLHIQYIMLMYSTMNTRALYGTAKNVRCVAESDFVTGINDLLSYIARVRIPSFLASVVFNLERLVRKKLLRRLGSLDGSSSSLRVSPRPGSGGSPQPDLDSSIKGSNSDRTMQQIVKKMQRRFWHELEQLSNEENILTITLVNVSSKCLQKERTIKKHTSSIVKHTSENPNGIINHEKSRWANQSQQSHGHLGVDEFYLNKEGRRVHFSDGSTPPERKDLLDLYMKIFWEEYLPSFKSSFFTMEPSENEFSILSRVFLDSDLRFTLLTCFSPSKHVVGKGEVPSELITCMTSLTTNFSAVSFIGNWDSRFQKLLPSSLKDRCRPFYKDDEPHPLTQTGSAMMKCFQPLLKLTNVTSKVAARSVTGRVDKVPLDSLWEMEVKCLSSLLVQVQMTLAWFMSKAQQFLASGSWELFFSIVKNDLNTVVTELEPLSGALALLSQSINSHTAPETYTSSIIEEIQTSLRDLKGLESESISKLVNYVKERSVLVWIQTMPPKKQWRKRGVTPIPFDPSPYVELASTQILSPLMDTMGYLDDAEVEKIFCKCVRVFVRTWMEYFLEEEIKFSYYGAHQLRLDLNYFRNWLSKERPHFSQEAASTALTIQIFDEFDGVISLLCCQPQSRHRGSSEGDLSTSNSASSSSVSQGSFSGSANFEDIIRDVDIPNKQQWLMLRAKGSRKTRLLCLSAPE